MGLHDLAGKRVVIAGATGDVGIEILGRLLDAQATVVAIVRSAARAEELPDHARMTVIESFPDSDDSVALLRSRLDTIGRIDGAIASLGPWHHGPDLAELPLGDWSRMLSAGLTSHFMFARSVMPALSASGGQYIMINGAAALAPVAHSGVVSIIARAQTMISEVLVAENPAVGVHTLMLHSLVATRARAVHDPRWITASEVGEACTWLLTPQGRLTAGGTVSLHEKASMQVAQ